MLRAVAPLGSVVASLASVGEGVREAFRTNRTLRLENASLHDDLNETRRELMRLMSIEEELRRAHATVDANQGPTFRGPTPLGPVAQGPVTRDPVTRNLAPQGRVSRGQTSFFVADVVYLDLTAGLRTLVLDGGSARPERNQVVRSSRGLVGRITAMGGRYGKVQLITDRASSVSAMIERTRRKGLVRGGDGGLELTLLPHRADVRVGDRVVAAGIDGVYPRGIPIGTVTSATPAPGLFLRIELRPAVDFGLLEDVYVLTGQPVPEAIIQGQPGATP